MIAAKAARCALFSREGCPGALRSIRPAGPCGVELEHPVANDLKRDPANPRRLGARGPFVNRRQRQKPPRPRSVLALPFLPNNARQQHQNRPGAGQPWRTSFVRPPSIRTKPIRESPARVALSGLWYYCCRADKDQLATPLCQEVRALPVDGLIAKVLLETLAPDQIKIAIAAVDLMTR